MGFLLLLVGAGIALMALGQHRPGQSPPPDQLPPDAHPTGAALPSTGDMLASLAHGNYAAVAGAAAKITLPAVAGMFSGTPTSFQDGLFHTMTPSDLLHYATSTYGPRTKWVWYHDGEKLFIHFVTIDGVHHDAHGRIVQPRMITALVSGIPIPIPYWGEEVKS
jgi:hypothetical protein